MNYFEKFQSQFERSPYELHENESIVQCHSPYPSYWFISSLGYLYSAYYKDLKLLKPNYRTTGKKKKNGTRSGQDWYYEYKQAGKKYNTKVSMQKLVAEHFLENNFDSKENIEVHHIQKSASFTPTQPYECNTVDNLQLLPKDIHERATYYGKHTTEELDEKSKECDLEIQLDPETFTNFILTAVTDAIAQGHPPIAYASNNATDLNDRTIQAIKITSAGYIPD